MTQELRFIEVPTPQPIASALPDGLYAVISYTAKGGMFTTYGHQESVFPWSARIYEFKDGQCDDIAVGSSISDMVKLHNVTKIYLLELEPEQRAELEEELSRNGIRLVPDTIAA